MADIRPFKPRPPKPAAPEEEGPYHVLGPALCHACKHEWQASAPVGTWELECPQCHCMTGTRKEFVTYVEEKVWTCLSCGCYAFNVMLLRDVPTMAWAVVI